jgi:hypothetical protein
MPSWQSARLARVAAASIVVAGTFGPCGAWGAELDLVQWLGDAAAPALQAAAPENDPVLAGREALNRALSGAFAQLQQVGPPWLHGVRLEFAFDPSFQPYSALSAIQPLFRTVDRDAAIDLHGSVLHDPAGLVGGHLGVRYRGRFRDRDGRLGLQGRVEDNWLLEVRRYTIETELGLGPLDVRASAFDEVHQNAAGQQFESRLDGYDLAIEARIPYLPWASLNAHRFWQVAATGEMAVMRDRLSLRLTPVTALEIEAGTQSEAALRSWFAQLRCRIDLGR